MSKSFFIKTFGCQMNERDSEIMAQSLSGHDFVETMDINTADLIIINTCSIREKAEQKVMSLLGYLRKNKKQNPQLKICVAGCVAQQAGQTIIERMPHVNLVIGTQHIYNIVNLIKEADNEAGVATTLSPEYKIPRFMPSKESSSLQVHDTTPPVFSKYVTIMQGCNNYCTYCVVPYTRGREVSRKYNDIIDEVRFHIRSGVKEIILLGQNVNSYGLHNSVRDDGLPCTFSQLLRGVSAIDGLERLRFTTSNPKDLSEDLLCCFKNIAILCPQFHLPVQSGSNRILKRMNRKYSVERYLYLVETLRKYRPDIVITTDIIVGFPGETESDFEETMNLLELVRFDGSFSFKYSDRPGTASCKYDSKVPDGVKSKRLYRFQERQNEICLEQNIKYIGKKLNVIIEEKTGESYKTRSTTNHVVHIKTNQLLTPGQTVEVCIFHAGKHSLNGRLELEEK